MTFFGKGRKMRNVICLAVVCVMAAGSVALAGTVLTPTEMRGLRNGRLLDFSAVKNGTTDRTIVHYNISSIGEPIDQASLTIPLGDIDPNPPYGTFEVFAFNGDGVVSGDEWNSGTLFHTFTGIGGWYPVLQCDVTNLLKDAVNRNVPFLSFNFRAGTGTDRYWLGDIQGLPYPTITIIPEPCTLLLLGIGGLLIRKR